MENDILTIDGTTYPVNIVSLTETSDFQDKYSEQTENFDLKRELGGIFFNYELQLGEIQNQTTALALYEKLHEFTEFHTVTLPHNDGLQTFQAYITGVGRPLKSRINETNKWGGYTITFTAKSPQITS